MQSQEDSLRALYEMQSDRHDPLVSAQPSLPDAVFHIGASSSPAVNPYSGLYPDLPSDSTLEQQGMVQPQEHSEAHAGDVQRDSLSRGSESHSAVDEAASIGSGSEEIADDGF